MTNRKSDIQRQVEERIQQKKSGRNQKKASEGTIRSILFRQAQFGISRREIAMFSRDLALLQGLGVSLMRSLTILSDRQQNTKLRTVVEDMKTSVEMGNPISSAMEKHNAVFGDFYVNAVRAGEESGELAKTLNNLADYLDTQSAIQSRMKRALTVPVLTILIALGVLIMLFVFVIPTFSQVYQDAGIDLPLITKIVILTGNFLVSFWWLPALFVVSILLLFYKSGKIIGLQKMSDNLKLRLPIVRGISERLIVYRFSHLASMMLNAGVGVLQTLRLAGPATGNTIIAARIEKACNHIDQGQTITDSFIQENVFDPFIMDTIGVGEEAGAVDEVLKKIAAYSQRDAEDAVSNLSLLIEPVMTLIMGLVVLVIALSMFLPYFNMSMVI
jgi:type II secretory pathway component PulF